MAVVGTVADAIANFEQASTGAEVKTALIDLLETLYSVGGNTKSLGGHDKSYYVTEEDLRHYEKTLVDLYLKFTKEPTNGKDTKDEEGEQLKLLRNEDFTDFFKTRILDAIRTLNADSKGVIRSGVPDALIGPNIKEALKVLDQTVSEIRTAIEEKLEDPHHVEDTDSFMDLGERLSEVNYNLIKVIPLDATENKEYEAKKEEGRYVEAYNPVNVKIKLKGQDIIATENNKDYTPEDGFDGISSVMVQVPDSSLSGSGSGGSSGGGGGSSSAFQGSQREPNVGPTTINANGEYSAKSYGLDAFDEVHVSVDKYELPEDTTFTVTFVDRDGTVLDTRTDVEPGSNVVFNGSPNPPVYQKDSQGNAYNDDFWVFSGWDPEPINVLSDLTCYAKFSNYYPNNGNPMPQSYRYLNKPVQGDVGGYGEWEDILKDGGNGANIGDVKLLKLNPIQNGYGTFIRMMKVGGIESNATSVWMSLDAIPLTPDHVDWEFSSIRTYLNGTFLQERIPDWLRPHIPSMEKYTLSSTMTNPANFPVGPGEATINGEKIPLPDKVCGYVIKPFYDRIYLPSFHELNILDVKDAGEFSSKIYRLSNNNIKIVTKDKPSKYMTDYKYPNGCYFGLIATDVGGVYYKGEPYSDVFKYFSKDFQMAQSYRDIIKKVTAGADKDITQAIRMYLPHISRTVTECEGIEAREEISKNWGDLEYDERYEKSTPPPDNYPHKYLEPPLDLYKILQTEKLSYLPGTFQRLGPNAGQRSFPYLGIEDASRACGTMVRDIYLCSSAMTYHQNTRNWDDPTYRYKRGSTNAFGFIEDNSIITPDYGVICFGLDSSSTPD